MATVEQCEIPSSGLSVISKSLNLYDTFQPSQEEKDSDEESFHLPMLDGDDDLESSAKEVLSNGMGKEINNDETEEDILNKFETNGTPDIDPKMEDSILDEIDNILENKVDKNILDNLSESKDISDTDKEESNIEKNNIDSSTSEVMEVVHETNKKHSTEHIKAVLKDKETLSGVDVLSKNKEEKTTEEKEFRVDENEIEEKESKVKEIIAVKKGGKVEKRIVEEIEGKVESIAEENKANIEENNDEEKQDNGFDEKEDKTRENAIEERDNKKYETVYESNKSTEGPDDNIKSVDGEEQTAIKISDKTEFDTNVQESSNTDLSVGATNKEKTDLMENSENLLEMAKVDTDLKDTNLKISKDDIQTRNSVEAMDTDNDENEISSEDNNTRGNSSQCTTSEIIENLDDSSLYDKKKMVEKDVNSVDESASTTKAAATDNNDNEPDKCENSNDSSKSQNLECEDLLDISIIRDADEDNASAIAEISNDAHPSEKSDNDNDDQEEGSDKADNELDESEIDQEDTLLANDKDDNMDFEDGGSNLCDQDNVVNGNISDSENKSSAEIKDMESYSEDNSNVLKQTSDINHEELISEKNSPEEENLELKDDTNNTIADGEKVSDDAKENLIQVGGKRSLSATDDLEGPAKKIKLSEQSKTDDKIVTHKSTKTKTLLNFEKFMQNKKLENKLTRSDLEQFCLQKICEAIMHKTDVGELHQTIKKQEQTIENLRKDLQQLTKQTRDLDIVNKKLMNELRSQNGTKKPLVPLKITRSVGLQVKLNASVEPNRRKAPMPTTPRTPNNNSTPARPRTITPVNNTVVRQVAASPRKTTTAAPLLSQALQNRQVTPATAVNKRPPIRPKPTEPQKPANSSVIDLTDEDDKAFKGAVGNSVKIINKTIPLSQGGKTINIIPTKTNHSKTVAVGQVKTGSVGAKVGTPTRSVTTLPQGVRLTQTQVKNGSIAIPANVVTSNSGTTQFMYVVQPGPVVTSTAGGTQKAVLLNFQPTNGVLTSTLNGSAVSVLPTKTSNTVQLKTVTTPRKHPAPLPSPPPITANTSLKPLLPKPHLSIKKTDTGIILQWRMPYNLDIYEAIASYQLFAYQETNAPPSTDMWRKVGDVKALALPMACTLTQFADKNKYYFAVRSIDVHKRIGAFSDPEEISL